MYYLSREFLIGRLLQDSIANLDAQHTLQGALATLGVELDNSLTMFRSSDGGEKGQYATPLVWHADRSDPSRCVQPGDHSGALHESNKADSLSPVLYPADSHLAGQELRLRQEYSFSAASLRDDAATSGIG